jgi:hypothetical protein
MPITAVINISGQGKMVVPLAKAFSDEKKWLCRLQKHFRTRKNGCAVCKSIFGQEKMPVPFAKTFSLIFLRNFRDY